MLRFAGSPRQELFSNYLLLAPWISQDAATLRPGNGGWATVGVPRIIAISVLNGFRVHAFDDLPVVRFAVDERDKGLLTPQYSFALAQNFRPERDYQANIRAIRQTLRVLVGQNDDVSYADRFAAVFKTAGKDVPVTVLPGIDHISLTLDPVAVQAAIAAVESMDHEKPNQAMQPTADRCMTRLKEELRIMKQATRGFAWIPSKSPAALVRLASSRSRTPAVLSCDGSRHSSCSR